MASFVGAGSAASGVLVGGNDRVQIQDDKKNTVVLFDVSVSESYTTTVTPTEFPVEGGATISDHLVRSPIEISFTGIISDTPIGTTSANLKEAGATAAASLLPPLGVAAAGLAYGLYQADSGDPTPSRAAYDKLRRLQSGTAEGQKPQPPRPFTLVTKLGTFKNMVIKTLTAPRSATSGGALEFSITFVQIVIVKAQSVNAAGVGQFSNPGLAAGRSEIGDQSTGADGYTDGLGLANSLTGGG